MQIFPSCKMIMRICWLGLTSTSTCPRDHEPIGTNQSEEQETLIPPIHEDDEGPPNCSFHQRMKKGGSLPSHLTWTGNEAKVGSRVKYLNRNQANLDKGVEKGSKTSKEDFGKRVFSYEEAPLYLRFNPFITGGYRTSITPQQCMQSVFWLTNESVNIWTHLIGWLFFFSLSIYDALGFLDVPTTHPWDQVVITLLLVSFQACMLLSSLYHIFCCHSERFYRRWLCADLFGVSLTLLAVYISGIFYAFSCVPFWLNFYLVTVGGIFISAMALQIFPMFSQKELSEGNFHLRLLIFGGWAAYGVIPTGHWALLHGGMQSPIVALLLPRIAGMYVLTAAAFVFYVFRIPERIWPGVVNYFGSSHQMWHVLIVCALYHWHNTGMIYLHFRSTNSCSAEYKFLFPERTVVDNSELKSFVS